MFKKAFFLVIVIILSIFSVRALLIKGLPPTHDGEYHIVRFYEFDKVIRSGSFYPRWAPDLNNGYGVPLFNYVYPFPNYFAFFLHLFGVSFIDGFKLNMFFATVIGSVFFYLWTRKFWGDIGALISSVFYTFSPYRFLDIFIRGSVGEVWALAFMPVFLWLISNFLETKEKKFLAFSSVSLALIIFSHNILGLMFFVFSLVYVPFLALRTRAKVLIWEIPAIMILGVCLSAVFWLPAIIEGKFVTGLQIYSVEDNFPELFQLLIPSWGSGFSESDLGNFMSFHIGIANLAAFFISIIVCIYGIRRKLEVSRLILFFIFLFVVTFFLMLKVSLPVWKIVPFMDYFQFPWRFLSIAIIILSFLAGSISIFYSRFQIRCKKHIFCNILLGIFLLMPIIFTTYCTSPAYYHNRDDNYYISRSNFIDGTNSPGNYFNTIWMKPGLAKKSGKIYFATSRGEYKLSLNKPTYSYMKLYSPIGQDIVFDTAYFPGWSVFIDDKKIDTRYSQEGLISFKSPRGEHFVKIVFTDTIIRQVAATISIISFIVLLFILLQNRIKLFMT